MHCDYACRSHEHGMQRRSFLKAAGPALAAFGWGGLMTGTQAFAEPLKRGRKRILNIFLHGGVSQLESWDPKPRTDTGGPFRAIPTSVPGVHLCELLPHTAKQMHHLTILRGLNTNNSDHGRGVVEMTTGHKRIPGTEYPHLGAFASKMLAEESFSLPGNILIRSAGPATNPAAFLGARHASVTMNNGEPPQFTSRPEELSALADQRRNRLRSRLDDRFSRRRRNADTDAYTYSYKQAQDLLAQREVFQWELEPPTDRERYGDSEFGRHCLLARRLLEHEIPFVQINHSNYDTHHENFNFHIEQLGEFDKPFATLIADLAERGLLEDTLVCVMSEFGRTPRINSRYGRDHWGKAWSVVVGGCGVQAGGVFGKTNPNGTEVVDGQVDHGHLFHTLLQAVGIDSTSEIEVAGRPYPIADPAKAPIWDLLV